MLVSSACWAWGQAAEEKKGSYGSLGTVVEESPAESKRLLFSLVNREANNPIAESAEAAEGQESHQPERFWMRANFLLWRIKGANVPPLVTNGGAGDASPGALGLADTKVLFGGSGLDYSDRSGGDFRIGWWLDDEKRWGLEGGYFFLAGRAYSQSFSSPGNPPLAVPFFNVATNAPDANLVAYPGIISGHVTVEAPSFLQSAEANVVSTLMKTDHFHLEGLAGFYYAGLNEGLYLQQASLVGLAPQYMAMLPGLAAMNGNTIAINDYFDTRNSFYGAQVGTRAEFVYKRLSLSILTKVAIGASVETVNIRGLTNIDAQPASVTNAGLLAVSSNSGQFTRSTFAVVPEIGLNLGFQLTDHIRVCAGYSFLYWSSVARPGDQVDTAINPNLVPTSNTYGLAAGPARPAFNFHATDFFAYGVNFGCEFRY
jgi:hypothetical protein